MAEIEEEDEIAVEIIDGEIIVTVVTEKGMIDAIETAVIPGKVGRAAADTRKDRVDKIKTFKKVRA